jgi:1-acyl-sn-glycerol-3-phosphate acyltransferase
MTQLNSLFQDNKFRIYFGSFMLFIIMTLSMLIIAPIIIIVAIFRFPSSMRNKLSKFWVDIVLWAAKFFCDLGYDVQGLENIPTEQQVIFLSKHQSAWETIAFSRILPRQVVFVLKKELLWLPVWGWALATLKHIAIDRKNAKASLRLLIEQGTARLNEGLSVVVFPEGTRTAPGEKRKFNAGGALLAQRSGYPVVPVAHNAGEFWPRYSFLKYPGTINVRLGPVIQATGRKAQEINQEAAAWIENAMNELS